MRSLILLALSGLLHAEVVVKQLHIHEGGTNYTQTITFDFDRNIQILEVPAHNHIVHSKTIFDFNQGVMIESHPEAKLCYMKDIPVGIVSMEKFGTFLDDNKGTIKAAKEVTTRRAYKTVSKVTHQQFSALATAAVTECVGYTTYLVQPVQVEEIEISYQRAPISLGKLFGDDDNCMFPHTCLWQTCKYASDSCWWTVNCEDPEDKYCSGSLEHSQVIHHCPNDECNIACTPCFNLQCPECPDAWNECHPIFSQGEVPPCPDDPELGKDCGQVFCPMVDDIPNGNWSCNSGNSADAKQPSGQTCLLFCTGMVYGGSITCEDDGNWSFKDSINQDVQAGDLTCN